MAANKTIKRGEKHHLAKLTNDDIRLIRKCAEERERLIQEARKLSNKKLAEKFGVHHRTIDKVAGYRGWIHV
jgi:hypothetical protein